jgi:RluA family pseudouridine synthase
MKRELNYIVKINDVDSTIVEFLTRKFSYHDFLKWTRLINEEKVSINNKSIQPNYLLKLNDKLTYTIENFIEPEVNKNIKIIFEDDSILLLDKPPNLPVHPSGRYLENTLIEIVKKNFSISAYLTHRLDRETSGLILLSKDPNLTPLIQKQFSSKLIQKEYICYVHGEIIEPLLLKGFLSNNKDSTIRKKRKFEYISTSLESEISETYIEPISTFKNITKLIAKPVTGKLHQIRASLQSIGYPIVGDKIYGLNESAFINFIKGSKEEYDLLDRQALHAYKLIFHHPINNSKMEFIAEEPDDMKSIFNLVEK